MKPILTACEHYDQLADSMNGIDDPPYMQEYMARWDGPPFWQAMGNLAGKDVLEVGIGVGRIAHQVLSRSCRTLTGLDISPKTLDAARSQLSEFSNLKLILTDITRFCQPAGFDVVCSVLTFMHVENKRKALQNIVESLRPGGHVVLSIDNASDSVDFGKWTVNLHPWAPEQYAQVLKSLGCKNVELTPLVDTWSGPDGQELETFGEQIATVVEATRTV